jgi:hypothetical protein|tara:strand:+ start:477 stop:620 length:144 start_codon:yes stop_codon:yes gene_type:complete
MKINLVDTEENYIIDTIDTSAYDIEDDYDIETLKDMLFTIIEEYLSE